MTDPIADMLTRIRNAVAVQKDEVSIPYSKVKFHLANILKQEGFICESEKVENPLMIRVGLKYSQGKPVITHVRRISKPGCKVYKGYEELPRVQNGYGVAIVSTSQGLMTDKDARSKKIGGEIICEVY